MESDTKTPHFVFKVDDDLFAVPINQVQNILEYKKPTPVPETPKFLLGIINVRGDLLPVVDAKKKFGFNSSTELKEACIVSLKIRTEQDTFLVGLLVDKAINVELLAPKDINEAPNLGLEINPEYLSGIHNQNNRIIFLLDVDLVFNTDEIIHIKNANN